MGSANKYLPGVLVCLATDNDIGTRCAQAIAQPPPPPAMSVFALSTTPYSTQTLFTLRSSGTIRCPVDHPWPRQRRRRPLRFFNDRSCRRRRVSQQLTTPNLALPPPSSDNAMTHPPPHHATCSFATLHHRRHAAGPAQP
jgi:hypothetical protein